MCQQYGYKARKKKVKQQATSPHAKHTVAEACGNACFYRGKPHRKGERLGRFH